MQMLAHLYHLGAFGVVTKTTSTAFAVVFSFCKDYNTLVPSFGRARNVATEPDSGTCGEVKNFCKRLLKVSRIVGTMRHGTYLHAPSQGQRRTEVYVWDSGLLGASRGTGAKVGGWGPSLCSSIFI